MMINWHSPCNRLLIMLRDKFQKNIDTKNNIKQIEKLYRQLLTFIPSQKLIIEVLNSICSF